MANVTATGSIVEVDVTSTTSNIVITETDSNVIVSNIATAVANVTVDSSNLVVNVAPVTAISNSVIRQAISVTDTGGDGSLTYSNITGVITYTGPSAAEVRSHFSVSNSAGSFGNINYDPNTGVFEHVGVTATEIRGTISSTGNIDYNAVTGVISESLTTTDIDEGDNLYYTNARVDAEIDVYLPTAVLNGNLTLKQYNETVASDLGSIGSTLSFDVADGTVFTGTLTANITAISIANIQSGGSATVRLTQDGIGAWVIDDTSLTNWKFINAEKDPEPTAGAESLLNIFYDGTDFYASVLRNDAPLNTVTYNGVEVALGASGNLVTANIAEDTNLYYTTDRANTAIVTYFGDAANGPFSINGNLDVAGNLNYVNVEDLLVNDQSITLNYGNATARDSFIIIDRSGGGGGNNTNIKWNESTNVWQFTNDGTTHYPLPTSTDDLGEGPTNFYFTTTRSNAAVESYLSVTDTGGDGSLTFGSGVFTYTGPSQDEANARIDAAPANVRAHFSAGTGVTITAGEIAIGQAVGTANNVQFGGITGANATIGNIQIGINGATEIDTTAGNLLLDSAGGKTTVDDNLTVTGVLDGGSSIFTDTGFVIDTTGSGYLSWSPTGTVTDHGIFVDLGQSGNTSPAVGDPTIEYRASLGAWDIQNVPLRLDSTAKDIILENNGTQINKFEIDRTGSNVYLGWNDTSDQWEFTNDGSNVFAIPTGGGGAGTVTSVTAGAGMTQSGNASLDPTLDVVGGYGITVNADDIEVTNSEIQAQANVAFGNNTTDNLTEGATNLYFTTDRANDAIIAYLPVTNVTISSDSNITTTANITGGYFIAGNDGAGDGFFIGDINGAVQQEVRNETGATIVRGKAVYLTGAVTGSTPHVALADNTNASLMPALGIVKNNIANASVGEIVTSGQLNIGTHGFALGSDLFINGTGDLQVTVPTGQANLIQKIGKVVSSTHIIVQGAFRTNATPNLDDGNFFLGNASNQSAIADFTDTANSAIQNYLPNTNVVISSDSNISTTASVIAPTLYANTISSNGADPVTLNGADFLVDNQSLFIYNDGSGGGTLEIREAGDSSGGPDLDMRKARGTLGGSESGVQAGDFMFNFISRGWHPIAGGLWRPSSLMGFNVDAKYEKDSNHSNGVNSYLIPGEFKLTTDYNIANNPEFRLRNDGKICIEDQGKLYADDPELNGIVTIGNGSENRFTAVGDIELKIARANNSANATMGVVSYVRGAGGGMVANAVGIEFFTHYTGNLPDQTAITLANTTGVNAAVGNVASGQTYYTKSIGAGATGLELYELYEDSGLTTVTDFNNYGSITIPEDELSYSGYGGTVEYAVTPSTAITNRDYTFTLGETSEDLVLDTGGTTIATFYSNTDIVFAGNITASGLAYPTADGTSGQVIQTDGNGTLSFATVGGSGTVTSVDSGDGLTGGPITGSGTLAVGAGYGITVSADAVEVNNSEIQAQANVAIGNNANIFLTDQDTTLTGTLTTSNVNLKQFQETVVALGNQSGNIAAVADFNAANASIFSLTATGGITISQIPNAQAGSSYTIKVTQDGTGSHALTSTFKYVGGDKTLSTAPNSIDVISVLYDGTDYLASLTKAYA